MRLSVTARLVNFVSQAERKEIDGEAGLPRTATRCNAGWSRVLRIGCGAVPDTMPLGKVASRMNPLDSPSP